MATYHNQASSKLRPANPTLHHGGRQCRIVAATNVERVAVARVEDASQQPCLLMTHMLKLILNTSIADTKHMNLTPCGLISAEIFQRNDMTSTLIKHASAYRFYSEYTHLYV